MMRRGKTTPYIIAIRRTYVRDALIQASRFIRNNLRTVSIEDVTDSTA
jgi:hypothetical protein